MIRASKYLDTSSCVINISTVILEIMMKKKSIKYENLYNKTCENRSDYFKNNFIYALDFLFLLGKIEYNKELDNLELIV